MNNTTLNKTTRIFLVNTLLDNALLWIIGYSIRDYVTWRGPTLELERMLFPVIVFFLPLSGIIFIVQSILLYKGKGDYFVFPAIGIIFLLIYYAIKFYYIVIVDSPFVLDIFVTFGEIALLCLLFIRMIQLIKYRF